MRRGIIEREEKKMWERERERENRGRQLIR
jgi:hypothetical protein